MEIRNEHIEFAIVQRFREMMHLPNRPYEVTSVYALFTAILCWSTQRLRANNKEKSSAEDRAAAKVWRQFTAESISDEPWAIPIEDGQVSYNKEISGRSFASSDFRDHSADRLIKNLRDAVAHGDARKVEPHHVKVQGKPDRTLIGFTFKCEEGRRENREWVATWTGEITLLADDMVRIADEVARRFCEAMENASKTSHLKEDAERGVKEAA